MNAARLTPAPTLAAGLSIHINGISYTAAIDPRRGPLTVRLRHPAAAAPLTVTRTRWGIECTCNPDHPATCEHAAALAQLGIMRPPLVVLRLEPMDANTARETFPELD